MDKKILIIVVAIILFLLGGGAVMMFMGNRSATAPTNTIVPEANTNQDISQASPRSLKDLLTAGIPQQCTFSDVNVSGTTYIQGGKIRGDFATTAEGATSTGHMIFDGTTSYVWMDGAPTGFKMDINPADVADSQKSQQGLDINKAIDYNCSAWSADQTVFVPPSNITFTGFTPPSTSVSVTPGSQSLCSSCDSLTGDQKTQCLKALNCN